MWEVKREKNERDARWKTRTYCAYGSSDAPRAARVRRAGRFFLQRRLLCERKGKWRRRRRRGNELQRDATRGVVEKLAVRYILVCPSLISFYSLPANERQPCSCCSTRSSPLQRASTSGAKERAPPERRGCAAWSAFGARDPDPQTMGELEAAHAATV